MTTENVILEVYNVLNLYHLSEHKWKHIEIEIRKLACSDEDQFVAFSEYIIIIILARMAVFNVAG